MDKEKQPDVEITDSEPIETPDELSQVTVDLDQEKKPDASKASEPPEKPKPSLELSKLNNTIAYQTRKLEQAMRELSEVKQQLASRPQVVQKESQNLDEIDEIAQKDWKMGVKKVVLPEIESKIEEILRKRDEAQAQLTRRNFAEAELDKSKQKVLQKYPQVEDEASEESSLYRQVISEDPSILQNVHGPEIAMYRMEERMQQMGRTPKSVKPIIDREVNRLARAGASSIVGRQMSQNGKITLTKEQKEFCDHYNIPYEQYAKNLKAESFGGVEV